jgi:RNase P/RNase MRP subunit p29
MKYSHLNVISALNPYLQGTGGYVVEEEEEMI